MDELFGIVALLTATVSLGVSLSCLGMLKNLPRQEEPAALPESDDERKRSEGVENILAYSVPLGRGNTAGGDRP